MSTGEPTAIDEVYRLKLTLRHIEPAIWRRVEVPARITLPRLHGVIQTAFGWFDLHLHEFMIDGLTYGSPESDHDEDLVDGRLRRLRDLVPAVNSTFRYAYDFGDGWEVDILVETIEPAAARMTRPVLLDGARAAPPEDVGGAPGYEHFLEAIADEAHEDHDEMLEWIDGEFDPEWFDAEELNQVLEVEFARGKI